MNSPPKSSPTLKKRTRRPLGSTNRKQLSQSTDLPQTPSSPTGSLSPSSSINSLPRNNNKSKISNAKSKLYQSTTASISKSKKEKDEDSERKRRENLGMMKCKFTATFEQGSSKLKTGVTYNGDEPPSPPTRFSSKPAPGNTHELTVGEFGTPFYARDSERFKTTQKDPQVYDRDHKVLREEHERGRLERIRVNHSRVEGVTQDSNLLQVENEKRRTLTVKRQQQAYQQAINERIAKGIE